MIQHLAHIIRNLITAGRITRIDDTGDVQSLQAVNLDGVHDDVARPQNYGLASHPPLEARAVFTHLKADPARAIVLAVDHFASRPKNLSEGEIVLYAKGGAEVRLTPDGNITITGVNVAIEADRVTMGALTISSAGITIDGRRVAVAGDTVTTPTGTGTINP